MNEDKMVNTKHELKQGFRVCSYCGKILRGYQSSLELFPKTYYSCNCEKAIDEIKNTL